MRIAIGCDHRGFELKQVVISILIELGHDYHDFGCYDTQSVDYPDIARAVAEAVSSGEFSCGVLICGMGIGMSIAANKVKGIRAALCHDILDASRARQHNNANILCLGAETIDQSLAQGIVKAFLSSTFEGGRHLVRVDKICSMETVSLDNK